MPDFGALEKANEQKETSQSALVESQKEIQGLVEQVWQAKLKSDNAESEFKSLKQQLTNVMDQAGVEKIAGKNCNVTCASKESVSVPKETMNKDKLFKYIRENHGPEVLASMLTLNARSFTSWYATEKESFAQSGDDCPLDEYIQPFSRISLGIRKKAIKKC